MTLLAISAPLLSKIRQHESDGAVRSQDVSSAYDVVWSGIGKADRPYKPLSQMSVGAVLDWQDSIDAKYGSEAAGAYQIMEDTLRVLAEDGKVSTTDLFDEATQDRLAIVLLEGRGLSAFLRGEISVERFGNRLAREWASLPVLTPQQGHRRRVERGESYYSGLQGNRAFGDPDAFEAVLRQVYQTGRSSGFLPALKSGDSGALVEHLQRELKRLGYPVGGVDKKYGKLTTAAVLAFQSENGLPVTGDADSETMSRLGVAAPREVSSERRQATEKDLRKAGSSSIRSADTVRVAGLAVGGAGAGGAILPDAETASEFSRDLLGVDATAIPETVQYFSAFGSFAAENWKSIAIGGGVFLLLTGFRIARARLRDHRQGQNLGR